MLKDFFQKAFPKNKNMMLLYVILIIGIVILLFGGRMFASPEQQDATSNTEVTIPSEDTERRLAGILSEIAGAGEVEVMITYESTGEKLFASDTSTETVDQSDTSQTSRQDIKPITPSNEPVVSKQLYPKVKGVIVVAEGAGDARVRQSLTEAVKAALDVADHKISVFVKK